MAKKTYIRTNPDQQLDRRMRAALGSIIHTQAAVRAVLDQAEGFMTDAELAYHKAYCALCRYDTESEVAFRTLCGALQGPEEDSEKPVSREKLQERLTSSKKKS